MVVELYSGKYPTSFSFYLSAISAVACIILTLHSVLLLQVMITPILIDGLAWKTYIIFMATNIVFIPIIYLFFPETSNLALEEVDYIFATDENSVKVARRMQEQLKLHELLEMRDSTTAEAGNKEPHVEHKE